MRAAPLSKATTAKRQAQAINVTTPSGKIERGILAQDLMTELLGVVPILGGEKVLVGFAGDQAFCSKHHNYVNIPALPPAKMLPIQIAREIRGFAAHEAAHLAFTDWDVFPSAITDANGNVDALLKEIWNCIEDFMIERNWLELYPGARKNFAATEIRCCRGYQEQYSQNPDLAKDLRIVGPLALTWLRAIDFGLGTQASRECFETLSPTLQARVLKWFSAIDYVETTQDCLDAARLIRAELEKDPYDPLDPPKSAQNPQQGQAQNGANQAGQAGNGSKAGKGQGSQSQQNANPQQGQGGGSKGAATGAASPPAQAPLSTSANLAQSLEQADAISGEKYINIETLSTAQFGPASAALADPEGYKSAEKIADTVRSQASAVSTQLRRALRTAAKARWKGGRMDGKIDGSRIGQAMTGGGDFYRRRIKGEDIDTALSVLIDVSKSMKDERLNLCQKTAICLETALAGTKVKHEVIGFTTSTDDDVAPHIQAMVEANKAKGTNVLPRHIGLYEFRSFGQSHLEALRTIGNMTNVPMSGTPTAAAVLMTHDRLAQRPERRHVMFVLTDGEADHREALIKAVKSVEACNVTVVGIGIATDAVQDTFSHSIVLNAIEDLPALMISQLNAILLGGKHLKAKTGKAALKARAVA